MAGEIPAPDMMPSALQPDQSNQQSPMSQATGYLNKTLERNEHAPVPGIDSE